MPLPWPPWINSSPTRAPLCSWEVFTSVELSRAPGYGVGPLFCVFSGKALTVGPTSVPVMVTPGFNAYDTSFQGGAPGFYLARSQNSAGIEPDRMDDILRSHVIDLAALWA